MDLSLFTKYTKAIAKKKEATQELIQFIYEKTGIELSEKEIQISKTKIKFTTTALKKSTLHIHRIGELLKEKGLYLTN
jgi:hypothetical protein